MSSSAAPARSIVVATAVVEAVHFWPDAPGAVAYLRAPHRHLFHVRGEWCVVHADRAVEFHIARRMLVSAFEFLYGAQPSDLGTRSCEQVAVELRNAVPEPRPSAVEVWEDGENGARVEWPVA